MSKKDMFADATRFRVLRDKNALCPKTAFTLALRAKRERNAGAKKDSSPTAKADANPNLPATR